MVTPKRSPEFSRLQGVVLAGGEGTRLRPLTKAIPKPMVLISGKPFLEHTINLLKRNSVDELLICIGYRGDTIRRYFANGDSFGIRIRYSEDGDRLVGTAGSLRKAESLLADRFFITFGDAYPILDYKAAWHYFLQTDKLALMTVWKNSNKYGRSNTAVRGGLVTFYSKKEMAEGMEYIEFGVTFIDKRAVEMIPDTYPVDLELLYRQLISKKEMSALEVKQRIYDIGSPEGLTEFRKLVRARQIEV